MKRHWLVIALIASVSGCSSVDNSRVAKDGSRTVYVLVNDTLEGEGAAGIQRLAVTRARARMMQVCSSAGLGAPVELRETWHNMNALSVNYRCADR
jgi:uncharacterized protein YceK